MTRPKRDVLPEVLKQFGSRLKKYSIERAPRVYFLVHRGEIVYVGRTCHLIRRLHGHYRDKDFDSVYYLNVCESDIVQVERELISAFSPRYNKPMGKLAKMFPAAYRVPMKAAIEYQAPPRRSPIRRYPVSSDDLLEAVNVLCKPTAPTTTPKEQVQDAKE